MAESRSRSGWSTALARVVEPEEPDGSGARVGADDGAERGLHLDLRLRPALAHHPLERLGPVGGLGVCDPDPQARRVLGRLLELADDLVERPLAAADSLDRDDLALADRQDRLHVQEL